MIERRSRRSTHTVKGRGTTTGAKSPKKGTKIEGRGTTKGAKSPKKGTKIKGRGTTKGTKSPKKGAKKVRYTDLVETYWPNENRNAPGVEYDEAKRTITVTITTWIDEGDIEQAVKTQMMINGFYHLQRKHNLPGLFTKETWARSGWGANAPSYELYTIRWAGITVEKNYDTIVDALFPRFDDIFAKADALGPDATYDLK